MEETKPDSGRVIGPTPYLLYLLRGPILVSVILILLMTAASDTIREALRYALIDSHYWYQLVVIAAVLALVCVAVRFSGEAIVELVAPELRDHPAVRRLAHLIPRLLALLIAAAVALPVFEIGTDPSLLTDTARLFRGDAALHITQMMNITPAGYGMAARSFVVGVAAVYLLIGVLVALKGRGVHTPAFLTRDPPLIMRVGFSLFPIVIAVTFAIAALGVFQNGVADRAVERYSSAVIGALPANSKPCGPLWHWVFASARPQECPGAGDPAAAGFSQTESDKRNLHTHLYDEYIDRFDSPGGPVVMPRVSLLYVLGLLLSLFAACYTARLALAAFLDVLFPGLGGGGALARGVRHILPPAAAIGLGLAAAGKLYVKYLSQWAHYPDTPAFVGHSSDHLQLYGNEPVMAWSSMLLFAAIGVLASLGSGSAHVTEGPWRESSSVGRRFVFAARRLAALPPSWQWFIRGLVLLGFISFLLFADLKMVEIPQWLGPMGIVLLWGATLTAVLFLLTYIGHMTRIPLITIMLLAAVTFAGFAINNNHEIRVVEDPASKTALAFDTVAPIGLVDWMASRSDLDNYDRYPVFLVATEGGGIRAAYFTATVLAAIQDRCPAFARHTFAISGVSGGSVGASVFAALAADDTANRTVDPPCDLDGISKRSDNLQKARTTLSADLLSPLLGAMLFPDTFQRFVPVPINSFDRSRALEFAIEKSWYKTVGDHRMDQPITDLYSGNSAVPHLLLNTTEAETGGLFPYTTGTIDALGTPFREQAEIDNGNVDCKGTPGDFDYLASCLRMPPKEALEQSSLQTVVDGSLRLSTAAIVSARFPYVTPAAAGTQGGHFIDGGYFENSGTWLINGLLQRLVGQQACLEESAEQNISCNAFLAAMNNYASDPKLKNLVEKVRRAMFVVIVIKSDPCDRLALGAKCDDDQVIGQNDSWEEFLSPLRGLLSTRGRRAVYSVNNLGETVALIEQLKLRAAAKEGARPVAPAGSSDQGCSYSVCTVTLEFVNQPRAEIPLTWLLSAGARYHYDQAVDGLISAPVRAGNPPLSHTSISEAGPDRVVGSYRRVFCALAATKEAKTTCTPAP